jgi:two-component system LytT family response regulator
MSAADDRGLATVEEFSRPRPHAGTARRTDELPPSRIKLRCGARTYFLPPARIDWIEAAGNYCTVHVNGTSLLVREQLGELSRRLPAPMVRIHRSTLVNADRVLEIRRTGRRTWTAVLNDGTVLPLADEHRHSLEEHLLSE